ncbi:MMPL family transporter [Curtobacterium sp. VKM Ac-2861]|uniref:MMPL family transporter n=1 Tax=Curtobacterium sp. VKM Ac-2861 TaxID=2739016 RepID=UPI0015658D7A|nr:MMPL family transporter [Curtobacterium sp. VKM Ac-2861]
MPKFLAAVGRFSARHRLIVIAAWLLIIAVFTGITATSADLGGGKTTAPDTPASKALDTLQDKFPGMKSSGSEAKTLQLVMEGRNGANITDADSVSRVTRIVDAAGDLPHVESVTSPFDEQQPYVSKDQTTAVSTLTFSGITDSNAEKTYDKVLSFVHSHDADLRIEVGGQIAEDSYPIGGAGEIVGLLVAFLILFLTFGSLITAGANMLVALSGVGAGILGVLAWSAIHPLDTTVISLPGMLGLAVGIDYSLFILTRFRAELRAGRKVEDAVAHATGTAGTAVVFAGLTVIIALVGLVVTRISTIEDMGFAGAFAIAIAVLAALTLLPVILRSLGLRALPKRDRETLRAGGTIDVAPKKRSFLRSWGTANTRHPLLMLIGGVAVLAIVAIPLFSMKTAANIPGGSNPDSTQRHAYNLIVDKFGGTQSPLLVLAEGNDVQDKAPDVQNALDDLAHVRMVTPAQIDTSGDTALFTVIPNGSPIDDGTKDLVHDIRDQADSVGGVHLEVTGETAIGLDTTAQMNKALIQYVVVIVVLSFLLLVVMFRSLLVPLFATLGYLLSLGAALGALTAVFQWKWLDFIIAAPQGDPLGSILPIILVGVLFGLAMDYQVFLVSRIREEYVSGLRPKEAILAGFSKSGPVIVAAALIMAFVFGGFASSEMTFASETAFGLLIGVLADAFIVRMVLMPALLALAGRAAWWMPKWLERIVPNLDTEGHSLTEDETAANTEPQREAIKAS